jgi:hypothetical protein
MYSNVQDLAIPPATRKRIPSLVGNREVADWAEYVIERLGGRLRDLHIEIDSRGVILRGSCASYFVKQLAQEALREVARLPIAANRIEVVDRGSRNDEFGDD